MTFCDKNSYVMQFDFEFYVIRPMGNPSHDLVSNVVGDGPKPDGRYTLPANCVESP